MDDAAISKALGHLSPQLKEEIIQASSIKEIPENTTILRAGQYVKVVPIVLEGLIKVFTSFNDKELLLYYIKPDESCIMSFSSGLRNDPSHVFAITEEPTTALLLPVDKMNSWIREYPDINSLFYRQYNTRYVDLLDTINHLLFNKMDERLMNYLEERIKLTQKNPLKISHRQIAQELGTAREVVSRIMKKLENEGKVKQHSNSIEML
ncbi:MAG: Crp/Fnr family transcriptional regulator [Bacteroidota bacterium]